MYCMSWTVSLNIRIFQLLPLPRWNCWDYNGLNSAGIWDGTCHATWHLERVFFWIMLCKRKIYRIVGKKFLITCLVLEKENARYNVLTEQKLEHTGIEIHSSHSKYWHWLAVKSGVLTSSAHRATKLSELHPCKTDLYHNSCL